MFERITERFERGYRKHVIRDGVDLGWFNSHGEPCEAPQRNKKRVFNREDMFDDDEVLVDRYSTQGKKDVTDNQQYALSYIPPDYLVLTGTGWVDTRISPGAYGIYD